MMFCACIISKFLVCVIVWVLFCLLFFYRSLWIEERAVMKLCNFVKKFYYFVISLWSRNASFTKAYLQTSEHPLT